MNPVSKIITPLLQLSPAARDDEWEFVELWREAAVCEPLFGLPALTVPQASHLLHACLERDEGLWIARSRATSRLLGALTLCGWPSLTAKHTEGGRRGRDGEFSIALLPTSWGAQRAHEAAAALLWHVARFSELRRLTARCAVRNGRGLRLLRRLGFSAGPRDDIADPRHLAFSLDLRDFCAREVRRARTAAAPETPIAGGDHGRDFASTDLSPWPVSGTPAPVGGV
jgi:RimJ/RimL family protein N-acetyltransferase